MSRNYVLNTGNGVTLYVGSNQDVGFHTANPTEKLSFDQGNAKFNSNVYVLHALGVGTSNPIAMFDVAGEARINGDVRVDGALSIGNPMVLNGFYIQKTSNVLGTTAISAAVENITVSTSGTSFHLSDQNQQFSFVASNNTNMFANIFTIPAAGPIVTHTHIIPSSNVTFDLGTSNMRFRDLYLSGNTINMDGLNISKDETGNLRLAETETGQPKALVVKELHLAEHGCCHTFKIRQDQESGGIRFLRCKGDGNEVDAHMCIPGLFPKNSNIGIGVPNPQTKLHVSDDAIIKVAKIGSAPYDPNYAIFTHSNQTLATGYALMHSAKGDTFLNCAAGQNIFFRVNNTDAATLVKDGKFGIGTSNPGYTLDVAGNIYAAGAITAFSDKRYKENVRPIVNAIETIEKLNGVSYTRRDYERLAEAKGTRHIGLLAQDVKRVLPEIVTYDDFNDKYGINYGGLVALLVEGMKEMRTEYMSKIHALERQLHALSK